MADLIFNLSTDYCELQELLDRSVSDSRSCGQAFTVPRGCELHLNTSAAAS